MAFGAKRLEHLKISEIRNMTRECLAAGGINMGQGVCDLPTPPLVRDGAIAAIQERKSLYSMPEGAKVLRDVIAEKLERDNQLKVNPDTDVMVTVGATGAYIAVLTALLNPGEDILLFEPYYGYHYNGAVMAGMSVSLCSMEMPEFTLSEEKIRAALKPTTRAMVVCTPGNPSGKMFTQSELEMLARIAEEYDLLVITDEIYEYIRYDNTPHISPATVANLWERSVTIMGLSKTFSITGWRLGYAVAKKEFIDKMKVVNDLYYVCAPTPLQHGVAAGFNAPKSFYEEMIQSYTEKRDVFCHALHASGLTPIVPRGAYYVLADVSRFGLKTSKEAAMHILKNAGVASIPGESFFQGEEGKRWVRFCFALEFEKIAQASKQIQKL